jgi:hypothetical protein
MMNQRRDKRAGSIRPGNDEGPTVGAVAPQEITKNQTLDCRSALRSGQALRVIDRESKAMQYLAHLHAQQADPDELALMVSMLYGATLQGVYRLIEKALGVHHA